MEKKGIPGWMYGYSLESIKEEYSDVLSDDLSGKERNIVGGEMKIHLRPGPVTPVRVRTAPQIPGHWQKMASELRTVIKKLEQRFNDMATRPRTIRADGGPCFKSEEFRTWCAGRSIAMEQSSARNSPSNGHAEASVANAKQLLLYSRLSEWLNCPRADGYSPAQMLCGFRQKGDLPAQPSAYQRINLEDAELKRQELDNG